MKRLFCFLTSLFLFSAVWAEDSEVFMPSSDCFPDPVLDSISIENNKIMVQDHVATSGDVSYIMGKVNPELYNKRHLGQVLYFSGMGGAFVGLSLFCTGYFWMNNNDGTRHDFGVAFVCIGAPIAAASLCSFVVGVGKTALATRKFKQNCLGISYNYDSSAPYFDFHLAPAGLGINYVF